MRKQRMKLQIPCGEFDLRVEGRADGVIIKGDTSEVIIDEIKGILRDLSFDRTAGECPSCSGKMLCVYICKAA